MGLENVTIHAVRAEEAGRSRLRDSADIVTARAVAGLRELLEYTAPLCRTGGVLALPKGSGLSPEAAAAGHALAELGVSSDGAVPMRGEVSQQLSVALFRKERPTPDRYPRRAGVPAKRPL
jgi:16S rRNA (guanine527-N7)-methyltransferase